MGKSVYIAEKPSVAQEFAKALHLNLKRKDGYLESDEAIVTWCVGHLVTMSYPEVYDEKYKSWSLQTLPFIPQEFLYEVIPGVKKQFEIVKGILTRKDVDRIYVCTDSGREGEYIYRFDHTIERRFNKFTDLPFPPYDHSKDTGHHTSDRYNRVFIPKII